MDGKKNQTYTPDLLAHSIIMSFARTVEASVNVFHLDVLDFLTKSFQTQTFQEFQTDYTVYGQGPAAIVERILEKLGEKGATVQPIKEPEYLLYDAEAGYWMGYLAMFLVYREEMTGEELAQYDWAELYWDYEILHTQDINYAADRVLESYHLDNPVMEAEA
jgi:hypothetical protein